MKKHLSTIFIETVSVLVILKFIWKYGIKPDLVSGEFLGIVLAAALIGLAINFPVIKLIFSVFALFFFFLDSYYTEPVLSQKLMVFFVIFGFVYFLLAKFLLRFLPLSRE
ncbi:hypothetical protein B1H10_00345 [candidate division KSB1 bacterium 4484_188]|nr:MAG: hypothetical protein B1H10_00345 [candidate division KSB1 bacterium 4484_188]